MVFAFKEERTMTAIAGIVEDGKVFMGGDSAGVGGYSLQTRSDPKVFINGEFIFGGCGSFRMSQLLEYEFSAPTPREGEGGMAHMVKRFIPAIKSTLKSGGFQETRNEQDNGGTFLVGYRGELYCIYDDYQVARVSQSYHACGCGDDLILGSLHATDQYEIDPIERINIALDAASTFSAGVRGPYSILSI